MRRYLYQVVTGERRSIDAAAARAALWPLGQLHRAGWSLLDRWHRRRPSQALPCRVISVGNIVVGGTGKTLIVRAIAETLKEAGRRVAILSRGYGGRSDAPVQIVSDGSGPRLPHQVVGDEPVMLASQLPGVPVLVGKDRRQLGWTALQRWQTEVLVLDDGFQVRSLERDLDLVALDATCPWGTGRLLPAGTLREPKKALERADLILLTHVDQVETTQPLKQQLRRYSRAPIVETRHQPLELIQADTREGRPLTWLRGRRVLAVCGIGNPRSFERTLWDLGVRELRLVAYPDHHRYRRGDIERIQRIWREEAWEMIVTTEKDDVRLPAEPGWFFVSVRLAVMAGAEFWRGCVLKTASPSVWG